MKKTVRLISLLLAFIMAAALAVGCVNTPPEQKPTADPVETTNAPADNTGAPADPTATPNPGSKQLGIRPANGSGAAVEGEPEKAFINASNAFAAQLVNAMGENWTGVVSPVSFGMLLEMLANGADAEQTVAILKAMLNEMGIEATNENTARLIAALAKPASGSSSGRQAAAPSKFSINSAMLVGAGDSFTEEFEAALADHFKAAVGNIDFSKPDEALEMINGWVNENTNGLIPKLFDQIPADTAMALVNALYFNGIWKTPFVTFKGDQSSRAPGGNIFNGINGEQPASMLAATATYAYGDFDGDQVVLVPYADGAYYMAVILPKEGSTPAAALGSTIDKFESCTEAAVSLTMPAIELTTKIDALESGVLDRLGLGGIASGDTQFPNIISGSSIRLTQFVHAAVLKVNEAGTEAGAASGATGNKSAPVVEPQYTVTCDRPYAMAIVHAETGAVLFASVVNELPSANMK